MSDTKTVTARLCFRDGGRAMLLEVEVPADASTREVGDIVLKAAVAAERQRLTASGGTAAPAD